MSSQGGWTLPDGKPRRSCVLANGDAQCPARLRHRSDSFTARCVLVEGHADENFHVAHDGRHWIADPGVTCIYGETPDSKRGA